MRPLVGAAARLLTLSVAVGLTPGCGVKQGGESDTDPTGASASGGSGGGSSGGASGSTGPAPEFCETRQVEGLEDLAGETDMQAICEGQEIVALHRPGSVECTTDNQDLMPCAGLDANDECQIDADCAGVGAGGTCASFDGVGGACACVIPCVTDGDCPADRACLCRSAAIMSNDKPGVFVDVGGCWPAECRTDDDCGSGNHCGSTNPFSTCVQSPRLSCRGPDGCQTDADCTDNGDTVCYPPESGNMWTCSGPSTCG